MPYQDGSAQEWDDQIDFRQFQLQIHLLMKLIFIDFRRKGVCVFGKKTMWECFLIIFYIVHKRNSSPN